MASNYKTPGVYVEEISLFPPSVAQVETAVPAFIGYTEMARKNGEDLTKKPTKITSLAEYESWFGKGPSSSYSVLLDSSDNVTLVTNTTTSFYLYESMRMFFDNGGGKCYIISVGNYSAGVSLTLLTDALAPLEKEDEPTLIVCPDAVLASNTAEFYSFQQKALMQCAKLGDRFLICDLLKSNETVANQTLNDRINDFRNNIGINHLKYGAAYAPWVNSALPRTIRFRDLTLLRGPAPGSALSLEGLTSNNDIIQLIYDLSNAKTAVDALKAILSTAGGTAILTGSSKTLDDEFKKLFDEYAAAVGDAAKLTKLKAIYDYCAKVLSAIQDFKATLPAKVLTVPPVTPVPADKTKSKSYILVEDIAGIVTSSGVKTVFETLGKHSNIADTPLTPPPAPVTPAVGPFFTEDHTNAATRLGKAIALLGITPVAFTALTDASLTIYTTGTAAAINAAGKDAAAAAYGTIISFVSAVVTAANAYEKTLDDSLASAFGTYKTILSKVSASAAEMPPSAIIAGVYAMVDGQRGVWKAPANVSLSSVMGPSTFIDNSFQDDMNVDVNAGKSVNAIRYFTGKGTLVWGARTLAGNDNEWRYVSVRRFYNMVEESVKKASSQFVFEPNDANTWVKVKAMIENFLTILWRQGALAGAKAEHAFFVKIGLGETMTAIDILEGRMNVEIGMAAVRPAEFIILKFSHKMQES